MIQKERIKALKQKRNKRGRYVLYWMQASQRTEYNHALEYAILKANDLHPARRRLFWNHRPFPGRKRETLLLYAGGLREVKTIS